MHGIQKGQKTYSGDAKSFDVSVSALSKEVILSLGIPEFHSFDEACSSGYSLFWKSEIKADEWRLLINYEDLGYMKGTRPDGGIVFSIINGRIIPVIAIEAKNQGNHGNAEERWFKNYELLKLLNDDISYITFLSGEGNVSGGVFDKTFGTLMNIEGLKKQGRPLMMNEINYGSVTFIKIDDMNNALKNTLLDVIGLVVNYIKR